MSAYELPVEFGGPDDPADMNILPEHGEALPGNIALAGDGLEAVAENDQSTAFYPFNNALTEQPAEMEMSLEFQGYVSDNTTSAGNELEAVVQSDQTTAFHPFNNALTEQPAEMEMSLEFEGFSSDNTASAGNELEAVVQTDQTAVLYPLATLGRSRTTKRAADKDKNAAARKAAKKPATGKTRKKPEVERFDLVGTIPEILVRMITNMEGPQLRTLLSTGGRHFTVGTLCSGTDAPIMALGMLQEAFTPPASAPRSPLTTSSASRSSNIFRDVVEFAESDKATTAAGAKADVPRKVDVLVVGSSCVDFSSLNPKKNMALRRMVGTQDVDDYYLDADAIASFLTAAAGATSESATTFLASLKYINEVRPKMVILENVSTAPWDAIINYYFHRIGYHGQVCLLDTVDYGLPQTRRRGYVLAVDVRHYGEDIATPILEAWSKSVLQARPRARIPLSSLVRRYGDKEVREHIIPVERGASREPNTKAAMCKMRHEAFRRDYKIPHARTLIRCWTLEACWANPCQTPAGLQFLMSQGRMLTGFEILYLQGIEADKLVPSTESDKDWKDLAGNAMTTTVVAAVCVSALAAEAHAAEGSGRGLVAPARSFLEGLMRGPAVYSDLALEPSDDESQRTGATVIDARVSWALDLFVQGRSYCPCDGYSIRNRAVGLRLCVDCGEYRCHKCAGNPKHNFVAFPISFPCSPSPRCVRNLLRRYDFYFDECHVGQCLTIRYKSAKAHVDVVIDEHAVTWNVYFDVKRTSSWKVGFKEDPHIQVVRAVLKGRDHSIIPGENDWELWVANRHKVILRIREGVDVLEGIAFDLLSVTNKSGEQVTEGAVYDSLAQLLQTEYTLTEKCGTSHALLYVNKAAGLYHFRDPSKETAGSRDHWIIAGTNRARCFTPAIAKANAQDETEPEPEPEDDSDKDSSEDEGEGSKKKAGKATPKIPLPPGGIECNSRATGLWMNYSTWGLVERKTCGQLKTWMHMVIPLKDFPFFSSFHERLWGQNWVTTDALTTASDENGVGLYPIRQRDSRALLRLIRFAIMAVPQVQGPAGRFSLKRRPCKACVPTLPPVHRIRNDQCKVVSIIEGTHGCDQFEARVNTRPAPMQISVRPAAGPSLLVGIKIDFAALIHRARGYLPIATGASGLRLARKTYGMAQVWHNFSDNPGPFLPLERLLSPSEGDASQVKKTAVLRPPSFRVGQFLRIDQAQAVAWMQDRENPAVVFTEEEVEEYVEPSSGIRIVGRVTRQNKARGGVLAQEVGFGKTVVTLALLDLQRPLVADCMHLRRIKSPGLTALKATLIIVPDHILEQWSNEIEFFLQSGNRTWTVVVLRKRAAFPSAQKLAAADIVLASFTAVRLSGVFRAKLADASGQVSMIGPDNERAFGDFYGACCRELRKLHVDSDDIGTAALNKVRESHQVLRQAWESHVPPSKRKKGARGTAASAASGDNFPGAKLIKKLEGKEASFVAAVNKYHQSQAALEFFSWTRIVYDEFSYPDIVVEAFVREAVAGAKWLLSGTPPLSDLQRLCSTASLINVHVAREEPALPLHLPPVTKGPSASDMSASEEYRALRQLKTATFAYERHRQAEAFVANFMSSNKAILNPRVRVVRKIVLVASETTASASYLSLQQNLHDARWDPLSLSPEASARFFALLEMPKGFAAINMVSQQERLNLSVKALLLAPTLPVEVSYRHLRGLDHDGVVQQLSVTDLLELIEQEARDGFERLFLLIKSQFDRLMWTAKQANPDTAENAATASQAQQDADGDDNNGDSENEGEDQEEAEDADEEVSGPMPGKQSSAAKALRANKYMQAQRYLADIIAQVADTQAGGIGGVEATYLIRACLLGPLRALLEREVEHTHNATLAAHVDTITQTGSGGASTSASLDKMHGRYIGLKDGASLRDHQLDKLTEKYYEFGTCLPGDYPILGRSKTTRGTKIEEALDDFILTSQSVSEGVNLKFVEALRRWRFLRSILLLARDELDGRSCAACGRCDVLSHEARAFNNCAHFTCVACHHKTDLGSCPVCTSKGCDSAISQEPLAPQLVCHSCQETTILSPHDAHVLAGCGHILCLACSISIRELSPEQQRDDGTSEALACTANKCGCPLTGLAIPGNALVTSRGAATIESLGMGGKLQRMVELVHAAKAQGDKVLVFVAYEEQFTTAFKALEAAGLDVLRTDDAATSSKVLGQFQAGEGDVLLQKLSAPESAGSNLTIANHIIFLGPLFTRDQRDWEMVMKQAVGRCNRPLQTKNVYVYHLVARHTLDVDVLSHHLNIHIRPEPGTDEMMMTMEKAADGELEMEEAGQSMVLGSILDANEIATLLRKSYDPKDTHNIF
ncbi:unnamed protein product [Parascedosporium putredinis]|uniref:SNF2 N-terminal domain-containing protein n=1 Tax=Parascedosporium putredinis TaxID=1442378 RepID=A0A9P1M797_9PEZI|nr:unnamed protein product [Parascedosporium putredinis]CAI7990055.1 unnamed protein product [Parascedosporium putredinis]